MTPKIVLIILDVLVLIFGLYMFFGALRNWHHFNIGQRRIGLIELFGVYGRLIYVIIGFFIIILTTLSLLAINDIGPLTKYLHFE